MPPSNNQIAEWSVATALAAAVAAAACCTIPVLLVALGVSGAWAGTLAALHPLRPFLVALAYAALGYAGYREWRWAADCDCPVTLSDKLRRGLLLVGLVVVTGIVASHGLVGEGA